LNRKELELRTQRFHIQVLKLCENFPRTPAGFELAKQLIKSAGSVGANYRASRRAKSNADFIYKIQVVLEEADESHYWLDVILKAKIFRPDFDNELNVLINEANELTAIFAAADKTAKNKR
jgi:four helix bundle protein